VKADTTAAKKGNDAPPAPQPPFGDRVKSEIIAWFWVILAFMLINGTLGQARVIPSGSMEDTLLIGDHLIMSRVGYDAGIPFTNIHMPLWRNPKRQQIIIFKPPFDPTQPDYVKRVIGLPGDTVTLAGGHVYIDGRKLDESWLPASEQGQTQPGPPGNSANLQQAFTVPANDYYVMGDNRTDSCDSRYWGPIPRSLIVGKVEMRVWPVTGIRFF